MLSNKKEVNALLNITGWINVVLGIYFLIAWLSDTTINDKLAAIGLVSAIIYSIMKFGKLGDD